MAFLSVTSQQLMGQRAEQKRFLSAPECSHQHTTTHTHTHTHTRTRTRSVRPLVSLSTPRMKGGGNRPQKLLFSKRS